MNEEKDTIEIDLLELAHAVWKKLWLVIIAVIIGTVAAFSYAKFMITPLYQSNLCYMSTIVRFQ